MSALTSIGIRFCESFKCTRPHPARSGESREKEMGEREKKVYLLLSLLYHDGSTESGSWKARRLESWCDDDPFFTKGTLIYPIERLYLSFKSESANLL